MDPKQILSLQTSLQEEAKKYQDTNQKLQGLAKPKTNYMTQLNENELVLKELELVEADAAVYKMVGPVLIKQDLTEARQNVGNRIKYFKDELERLERSQRELETAQEQHKEKIMKLQENFKQLQTQANKSK